jgi:hypothetical protein
VAHWRFWQNAPLGHGQSTGQVPQSSSPGAQNPSPQIGTHWRLEQMVPCCQHGQSPGHVPQSSMLGAHTPSPHTAAVVPVSRASFASSAVRGGEVDWTASQAHKPVMTENDTTKALVMLIVESSRV